MMFWQIVVAIGGVSTFVLMDILIFKYWETIHNIFNNKKGEEE